MCYLCYSLSIVILFMFSLRQAKLVAKVSLLVGCFGQHGSPSGLPQDLQVGPPDSDRPKRPGKISRGRRMGRTSPPAASGCASFPKKGVLPKEKMLWNFGFAVFVMILLFTVS